MVEKKRENKQLWRLEDNGYLRNKAHILKCLGLDRTTVGGVPVLELDLGVSLDNSQRWKYQELILSEYGYIVNKVNIRYVMQALEVDVFQFRSSILVPDNLSLNVIWGDVPLISDGVPVNVVKQDGTQSMKWKFVEP